MSDKSSATFGFADFLSRAGLGRRIVQLEPEQSFFTQGNPSDSVFCLQRGRAKLTVVAQNGKQATVTLLSPGDFFGEEALASGIVPRFATATALNTCTALKIRREEVLSVMHRERAFSDRFLSCLVDRSLRTQDDLVDQLFNSSEKRLARALLLLAGSAKPDKLDEPDEPRAILPPITQQTLAEMIGTTRSRVSFFMNRFRSLGLIDYKRRIRVHRSRLNAVLLDELPDYNSEMQPLACAS
jgi:CRP-like cAMP-binding protein